MNKIVDRKEVLEYMKDFLIENQCVPRLDDIAHKFNITRGGAWFIVHELEDDGYITRSYKGGRYKISNIRVWVQKTDE